MLCINNIIILQKKPFPWHVLEFCKAHGDNFKWYNINDVEMLNPQINLDKHSSEYVTSQYIWHLL